MREQQADVAGGFEIHRALDRFVTSRDGISTRHCFSFGEHYDPARIGIRTLVAMNDETIEPGAGYAQHLHRDVDIVSWVLDGVLRHEDSLGTSCTLRNPNVLRLTAGPGVTHTETNGGAPGERLRFLQLWFALDREVAASCQTHDVPDLAGRSGAGTIASSGATEGGAALAVRGVDVSVCRLPRQGSARVDGGGPGYAETFTYVASGVLETSDGVLREGDSVRSSKPALDATVVEDVVTLSVRFRQSAQDR